MSLTADGFDRRTLPEVKTDLDADLTSALGPVNTNPDAVLGQISGIIAEAIATIEEIAQDTYDAMYPNSAEGTSLDGAVQFVGMARIEASPTVVTAAVYGAEGEVIPVSQLVVASGVSFTSTSDIVVSRANSLDVEIEVATLTNSTAYQVLAGGSSFTYTSDSSATEGEIVAGLAALIDADDFFVATSEGETLRIYAADGVSPFAVTVDAKLSITRRGSPIVFSANEDGAVSVPIGAFTSTDSGYELYNVCRVCEYKHGGIDQAGTKCQPCHVAPIFPAVCVHGKPAEYLTLPLPKWAVRTERRGSGVKLI